MALALAEPVHGASFGHPFVATWRWVVRYGFWHGRVTKPRGARHARGAEAEYDEYGDGVYDDYAGDDDYYQPQQQQY